MSSPIFISGWATRREQFSMLTSHTQFIAPFTETSPEDVEQLLKSEQGNILVGWSTGAHMILKVLDQIVSQYEHIFLAAPFLSFGDSLPARITQGMIRDMDVDPQKMVDGFHANCGESAIPSFDPKEIPELTQGLQFLLDSNVSPDTLSGEYSNVTVIHGKQDRIVRAKAVKKLMPLLNGATLVSIESGHKIDENSLAQIIHEATDTDLF